VFYSWRFQRVNFFPGVSAWKVERGLNYLIMRTDYSQANLHHE
jgi:hypothetical protein